MPVSRVLAVAATVCFSVAVILALVAGAAVSFPFIPLGLALFAAAHAV